MQPDRNLVHPEGTDRLVQLNLFLIEFKAVLLLRFLWSNVFWNFNCNELILFVFLLLSLTSYSPS